MPIVEEAPLLDDLVPHPTPMFPSATLPLYLTHPVASVLTESTPIYEKSQVLFNTSLLSWNQLHPRQVSTSQLFFSICQKLIGIHIQEKLHQEVKCYESQFRFSVSNKHKCLLFPINTKAISFFLNCFIRSNLPTWDLSRVMLYLHFFISSLLLPLSSLVRPNFCKVRRT